MILADKTPTRWDESAFVARVTTNPDRPASIRHSEALFFAGNHNALGFRAYLCYPDTELANDRTLVIPESLKYVADGDILAIAPRSGEIRVLYRKAASCNALLLTRSCNNHCVMCSQPPQAERGRHLLDLVLASVPLIDPEARELILTGGEPTLLGEGLIQVLRACRNYLPYTGLHVLTNARLFRYLRLSLDVAKLCHPDLVFGVPLYSDVAHQHDFIVQSKSAFDEALKGILNLARCGQRVELRIVITKLNAGRLPDIARFICRNLPFACNVAFMGLEPVGFARPNLDAIWIDPLDYEPLLREAVEELASRHVPASVYNHQLCTLQAPLWPYSRQSISDWKNTFLSTCDTCAARTRCCGFFASSSVRRSRGIANIPLDTFLQLWKGPA